MNSPDQKVCEGRIQDAVPEAFAEFQSALQAQDLSFEVFCTCMTVTTCPTRTATT